MQCYLFAHLGGTHRGGALHHTENWDYECAATYVQVFTSCHRRYQHVKIVFRSHWPVDPGDLSAMYLLDLVPWLLSPTRCPDIARSVLFILHRIKWSNPIQHLGRFDGYHNPAACQLILSWHCRLDSADDDRQWCSILCTLYTLAPHAVPRNPWYTDTGYDQARVPISSATALPPGYSISVLVHLQQLVLRCCRRRRSPRHQLQHARNSEPYAEPS